MTIYLKRAVFFDRHGALHVGDGYPYSPEEDGTITTFKACPHYPDASIEMMRHCECRKPSLKMIYALKNEHGINFKASIMLSDRHPYGEVKETSGYKALLFSSDGHLGEFVQIFLEDIKV